MLGVVALFGSSLKPSRVDTTIAVNKDVSPCTLAPCTTKKDSPKKLSTLRRVGMQGARTKKAASPQSADLQSPKHSHLRESQQHHQHRPAEAEASCLSLFSAEADAIAHSSKDAIHTALVCALRANTITPR